MSRRFLLTCVGLFLLGQVVFLPHISYPSGYSFDEFFYVPAARAFATWSANTNRLHPPLGKYLIAIGIALCGDQPFGWRVMSSIFGGFTLAGMYCWALMLFREHRLAVWTALVALVNQMLYVLARTAQLDAFLFCFMVWGMAAFTAARQDAAVQGDGEPRRARRLLFVAGVMFGLAMACKWSGVVPLATALLLCVLSSPQSHPAGGGRATLLRRLGAVHILLALVAVPIVIYCVTFLPLLTLPAGPDSSLAGLWQHQAAIWHEHTTAQPAQVQASRWYQWPLSYRPMWFWFEREGEGRGGENIARAILLFGNPAVLWTGVAALLFCTWSWFKTRSQTAFAIVAWYGALWLSWAVIPRRVSFLYYYYPAAMVLTLALAYAAARLSGRKLLGLPLPWLFFALATAMFALQLPFSSGMRVPLDWIRW